MLYSGHLPGAARAVEPPLLFTACRTTAGNTFFVVAPAAQVLAVRGVRQDSGVDQWVLVLAPTSAATLEVTRPNGAVETVPLVDGVGSIQVPEHQRVQLRALNAAGAQVGTGAGPIGESQSTGDQTSPPTVDNWS